MARSAAGAPARALLTAALLAPACGVAGPGQDPPATLTLKVFRLPTPSYAPLFVAEEEGFFAAQGLTVELVDMKRSADALPALIRGDLDVTGDFVGVGYLNAMARGSRIRFVADKGYVAPTGCDSNAFLASRTFLDRGGLRAPSPEGRVRLGVNPRSASAYFAERLLARDRLTLDDVVMVDTPQSVREMAMDRTVDVAFLMEPALTRTVQSGRGIVWASPQDVAPDFQLAYIVFGPTLLDRNPDAGRRFMIAYLQAVRQLNRGKTDRNLDILVKHTGHDRALLEQACWPPFRPDGRINIRSVPEYQSWAIRRGLVDVPVVEEQFWDSRFVDHANRVLDGTDG